MLFVSEREERVYDSTTGGRTVDDFEAVFYCCDKRIISHAGIQGTHLTVLLLLLLRH